ncbi:hypothetical protein [Pararhodospirillum photometricum]|uniref:hypothetical protein n=1 Tax=Pararhodospirillum photometricum TaxID=1084 RepID=UPI001F5A4697|nr:hypothetical protein [Pararhodospirillum photometricum]
MLLLDEVSAHLDATRRAALLGEIDALGAQAWVTGTDPQAFEFWTKTAQFLRLDAGAVLD